ncbi:hypothetical protein [Symbiobacterium thermophilum]|uniref:Uncharacterized protein n=2 Tax=Symbiobacterium thermophilum TaxID=2734 RepID=Q67N63_SYMTH|nr:hypothetical protein [Symbiobacterium thermophilum]MBY6277037.1 hypothetical protein [Symbiobacterium thermophilum]BAD40880.1 hypothetical protein STH1895 [Symbiobacterium thermophilum IAM 14863]
MGKTVVGLFRHSGDADLAAAHLRDAFALDADRLNVIGEADLGAMSGARISDTDAWLLAAFADVGMEVGLDAGSDPGLDLAGSRAPVFRRWGDQVRRGRTLVVARADDPDEAVAIAGEMRRAGADRVDLIGEENWPAR